MVNTCMSFGDLFSYAKFNGKVTEKLIAAARLFKCL